MTKWEVALTIVQAITFWVMVCAVVIIVPFKKEDLKLGESPASFLSCNRTIVRIQRRRIR